MSAVTSSRSVTTASGARIAYDTFGDPSAAPLVLIAGFSAHRVSWMPGFCELIAERGFHVIRFDNRDVGESQRYVDGGYGLGDLATDTADLLDGLGLESAHIVGQSMGGMIAQYLAVAQPRRVRSLGLLYTTADIRHIIGADSVIEQLDAPPPSTREEFIAAYPVGEAGCRSAGYPQDLAWLAEVAGQMWDNGVDPDGVQRQLPAILALGDRTAAARTIRVPTAILVGDSDLLIDHAASLELHELIEDSTLTVFPGMGHELPRPLWGELTRLIADNARAAENANGSAAGRPGLALG